MAEGTAGADWAAGCELVPAGCGAALILRMFGITGVTDIRFFNNKQLLLSINLGKKSPFSSLMSDSPSRSHAGDLKQEAEERRSIILGHLEWVHNDLQAVTSYTRTITICLRLAAYLLLLQVWVPFQMRMELQL